MRVFYPLLLGASLSLAPAVAFANTSGSPSGAPPPVLQQPAVQQPATPRAAPSEAAQKRVTDQQRYASREQTSPDAAAYRGGDTVVIGASAATAILAIVLLVILL